MLTCDTCGKKYKNASGLTGHVRMVHDVPKAPSREVPEERLVALEKNFDRLLKYLGAEESQEVGEVETTDIAVTQKDLKILDLDRQLSDVQAQLEEAKNSHTRFAVAVGHAKEGDCDACIHDLQQLSEDTIGKALERLSNKALLAMVIARGIIPETIRVEIPG